MTTSRSKWYVIVRHEAQNLDKELCEDCGNKHAKRVYPAEGYPILIFADKERAVNTCKGNPYGKNPGEFEVVEVAMVAGT